MTSRLTDEQLQEAVDLLAQYGSVIEAAKRSKWPCQRPAFSNRLRVAADRGFIAQVQPEPTVSIEDELRDQVKTLRTSLSQSQGEEITRHNVRSWLTGLEGQNPSPPKWLSPKRSLKTMGVPTLFCSDWHWGEVVNPSEIHQSNEFNLEIARKRARRLVETSTQLLTQEFARPDYPGIIVALGGDMITGDIHEELSKTNDAPVMPTVVDLYGVLIWVIETLADQFGKVFVPCVTGNHGRNTKKTQSKERNATNFDWLVYSLLEKHFARDERITFYIPDGPDCLYRVYGHRYLLTHGDQFRGGDGLIGPIGPLARGRHKKQSRNTSINMGFDTMICGHFHTLMQLPHLIVNGALKGYDEYAYSGNFSFELPAQALWITHPERGITHQMPIYLEDKPPSENQGWVSVAA